MSDVIWCRRCLSVACADPKHQFQHITRPTVRSDQAVALEILCEAAAKLEPLYDYLPNRPLGWMNQIVDGLLEELAWKVWQEERAAR